MGNQNCITKRGIGDTSFDISGEKDHMSDVLVSTLSLLGQYKRENESIKQKIIKELDDNQISYTYGTKHELIINFEQLKETHISDEEIETYKQIERTYNQKEKCNQDICANMESIQKDYLDKVRDSCKSLLKGSMDLAGTQILEAQEKERNRIARDLHDSVVQNLTNMVHKLELCIHEIDRDVMAAKLDLQIMMKYVRDIINDIREIIYNLRPMTFDDLGIVVAIQRYIDVYTKNTNVSVNLEVDPEILTASNSIINLTLLRIIQESCANAHKHGGAKHIDIKLRCKDNEIELMITDDGSGFDVDRLPDRKHTDNSGFGLSIMRERVYLLSGDIRISSERGKGTSIRVNVPTREC